MLNKVRSFVDRDTPAATQLFFDTVQKATASYYNQAQRNAWASTVPNVEKWRKRLSSQTTLVIDDENGLAGFMAMGHQGHIDLAFIRHDLIGNGVGKLLYEAIEAHAKVQGLQELTTDASEMARGFFLRQGWQTDQNQRIARDGVELTNYKMSKRL